MFLGTWPLVFLIAVPAAAPGPQLPDFYTLVDAGAVRAPACPCIAEPFRIPSFRAIDGYHVGPAAPPAPSARPEPPADIPAPFLLAYRYRDGIGVEPNDQAAAYWFYKDAADGGNVGMVALGMLYAAGRGVPQDWIAAVYWWQRAAPTHPLAARLIGDAYLCGYGVAASNELALAAYKHALKGGDVSAAIQLGHMYANSCAPPDDEEAVKSYRHAADEGYPEAQVALSALILVGRGAPPDPHEAYYWARLAERRSDGAMQKRASAAVAAAARRMTSDAIAAADRLVDQMIAAGAWR
jgi:TPR repeat protein